jgi:hypothetical protein
MWDLPACVGPARATVLQLRRTGADRPGRARFARSGACMARRSLRPHSTRSAAGSARDAPTPGSPTSSRSPSSRSRRSSASNELGRRAEAPTAPRATSDDEIDLRAEDDALIAAELEAAEAEAGARRPPRPTRTRTRGEARRGRTRSPSRARRRGRRGGARRAARRRRPLEGTFDHGEEGYGLWLDPAVAGRPVYAEHWAGHRPVEVTIEEDQIVIRRAGGGETTTRLDAASRPGPGGPPAKSAPPRDVSARTRRRDGLLPAHGPRARRRRATSRDQVVAAVVGLGESAVCERATEPAAQLVTTRLVTRSSNRPSERARSRAAAHPRALLRPRSRSSPAQAILTRAARSLARTRVRRAQLRPRRRGSRARVQAERSRRSARPSTCARRWWSRGEEARPDPAQPGRALESARKQPSPEPRRGRRAPQAPATRGAPCAVRSRQPGADRAARCLASATSTSARSGRTGAAREVIIASTGSDG